MKIMKITILALFVSSVASAADVLNLSSVMKNYFPEFETSLQLTSKNGFCSLVLSETNGVLTLQIATSPKNQSQFSAPALFVQNTAQVEQTGKNKDQGYYSYTKFSQGTRSTTLIQGLFYYEPSLDPADSFMSTTQEQKVLLQKTAEGTQIQFWESAGEKPRYFNCVF